MADEADGAEHFTQTIGALPESVATMQRHAPAAYAAYLAARENVYRDPPAGHLDRATTELLFIVLDVVAGHEEGALAHAEAGVRAGLTVGQITEALMIAVLINGHAPWGKTGYKVVEHAARVAGQLPD
ncbi:MAG: carboxymuconolactone decarboxylase family protein [Burkholderiales bacterium]